MRKNASDGLVARFSDALARFGFSPSQRSAIAVSGGGDSIALMHLLAEWCTAKKAASPVVLTVDHGLRAESHGEALQVKFWAEAIRLPAFVLVWRGPKPATAIEEKARAARYRLMGRYCVEHDITSLFLGHTRDDEAENFLLRLGRGSGVDGLAAMNAAGALPMPGLQSVRLLRPLLDFGRGELRDYLNRSGASWFDDPMNDDLRFARNRIRKLIPALAEAGIPAGRIVDASRHLARARTALDCATQAFLAEHAEFGGSTAILDTEALAKLPREIGLRALSQALLRVSAREYRPRFARLERLFDAIISSGFRRQTLAGCCIERPGRSSPAFGLNSVSIRPEAPRKALARPRNTGSDLAEGVPDGKLP